MSARELLRVARADQIEKPILVRGHALESLTLRAPIEEIRGWSGAMDDFAITVCLPGDDQLLGVWVWQRLQDYGVDDAEDRRVGANAQSECEHSNHGEGRALAEQAAAIQQILPKLSHRRMVRPL